MESTPASLKDRRERGSVPGKKVCRREKKRASEGKRLKDVTVKGRDTETKTRREDLSERD